MAGEGVNIPVRVTGVPEAQAAVGQVGQSVEQLGAKEGGLGEAGERAARGQKKANDELFDFNNKGEKALKGVLAEFSPKLANMADLALDLAEGFGKVNTQLLAVAGVGAAIGALAMVWQAVADAHKRAREELERYQEVERGRRDEQLRMRSELVGQALKFGLDTEADVQAAEGTASDLMQGRMLGGKRFDPKQSGRVGLAMRFAQSQGIPFDAEQFIAGIAMTGGEFKFGDDAKQSREAIERVLKAGASPDAAGARDRWVGMMQDAWAREIADFPERPASAGKFAADTRLVELEKSGRFKQVEVAQMQRLVDDPVRRRWLLDYMADERRGRAGLMMGGDRDPDFGSALDDRERELIQEAERSVLATNRGDRGRLTAPQRFTPTVINIHTENVATKYSGPPHRMSPDVVEGFPGER